MTYTNEWMCEILVWVIVQNNDEGLAEDGDHEFIMTSIETNGCALL